MNHKCRDCSKCTERPLWRNTKKVLNLVLAVGTLGTSAAISYAYRSGLRPCPQCGHPLRWHKVDKYERFLD